MITSAIKVAYTRATATSRDLRLVMDLDHQRIWLEASDRPMLVKSSDVDATGGAAAVTKAEQAALAEGERIVKGPVIPKPAFTPIDTYGFGDGDTEAAAGARGKGLQRGIQFRSVQTAHDDAPRTSGRAYLYFWPGGRTERAAIQIRIGESIEESRTLTLLVSPLTGQVAVKGGAVELKIPTDDDANSRLDFGF
jgi:general secretion pathway protein H